MISCNSLVGTNCDFYLSNLFYPLLLMALGILICLLVSTLALYCANVDV